MRLMLQALPLKTYRTKKDKVLTAPLRWTVKKDGLSMFSRNGNGNTWWMVGSKSKGLKIGEFETAYQAVENSLHLCDRPG